MSLTIQELNALCSGKRNPFTIEDGSLHIEIDGEATKWFNITIGKHMGNVKYVEKIDKAFYIIQDNKYNDNFKEHVQDTNYEDGADLFIDTMHKVLKLVNKLNKKVKYAFKHPSHYSETKELVENKDSFEIQIPSKSGLIIRQIRKTTDEPKFTNKNFDGVLYERLNKRSVLNPCKTSEINKELAYGFKPLKLSFSFNMYENKEGGHVLGLQMNKLIYKKSTYKPKNTFLDDVDDSESDIEN